MKFFLSAKDISEIEEASSQHQFNENAVRLSRALGDELGLERIGIHLVRLASGGESTQHHYHESDEEFIYILSGHGIAEIGDETIEVGPGDFMGFAAPSPPHSLNNPNDDDLVYLMGGERNPVDVVHYPRIRRTMIKSHGRRQWLDWDNLHDLNDR